VQLRKEWLEIDPAVSWRIRREPTDRLCQLTFGCDRATAVGLVPGDRDVHESLEEVALLSRRRPPFVFELLVRGEVLAGANQLDAGFKS
jgi:hypothetical protein